MKFDDVVAGIGTITDLRRIAGAHVVDHKQLRDDELRAAIIKVKPQYLHRESVQANLNRILYQEEKKDYRVLARVILIDVLLEQYGFSLPFAQTEEKTIAFEQSIVNRANETNLLDLAYGQKNSQRHENLKLYNFVLEVAWERQDNVSPDEANLLLHLRQRLNINERDHRTLEAKIMKYPKPGNQIHSRSEINQVRRHLQGLGLLFTVRQDERTDIDIVPEELVSVLREILSIELRSDSYRQLLNYRLLHRKSHLTEVLTRCGLAFGQYDTVNTLIDHVLRNVSPSQAIAGFSPKYGLNSDQLTVWCKELHINTSGSMEDRIKRIIVHFDQLRPSVPELSDERVRWYEFYEQLAIRDYETLRAQHVIEKDIEIESKFEDATRYIFAEKLKHVPLQQEGINHPDGLLSLEAMFLMWDNKSKESPGLINLKDHIAQFDGYMNNSDKLVPVFLVIAPGFTEESEGEAIRYHAQHFDRNIVLITASELKNLAEEWVSENNRNREEPFPLGLLASTGRFSRKRLGKLI